MRKRIRFLIGLLALGLLMSVFALCGASKGNGETVFGTVECPKMIHFQPRFSSGPISWVDNEAIIRAFWQILLACHYEEIPFEDAALEDYSYQYIALDFDETIDPDLVSWDTDYYIEDNGRYLWVKTTEDTMKVYTMKNFDLWKYRLLLNVLGIEK